MPRIERSLCVLLACFTAALCAQTNPGLNLVCVAESTVVHPGRSVGIRAWVTDRNGRVLPKAPKYTWHVEQGDISGGEHAVWSFPSAALPASTATRLYKATLVVDAAEGGTGQCEVEVLVVRKSSETDKETARERSQRLTARSFLLRGVSEPNAYGLRSYLVFANPPRDEPERERCIKAIEAYLRVLAPAEDFLAQNVRTSRINLTMLPVKQAVELPEKLEDPAAIRLASSRILGVYDYARAKVLLSDLGLDLSGVGPYLLSRETRSSSSSSSQGRLFVDMNGVAPSLVWDWMTWFCWLAGQERSWSQIAVRRLGLNLRNIIAVTGSTPRVAFASITQSTYVLKPE